MKTALNKHNVTAPSCNCANYCNFASESSYNEKQKAASDDKVDFVGAAEERKEISSLKG